MLCVYVTNFFQQSTALRLEQYQKSHPIPNTQYYWVLPIQVPNTNTDTRQISGLPSQAAALSGLDMGRKALCCAHCVKVTNVM